MLTHAQANGVHDSITKPPHQLKIEDAPPPTHTAQQPNTDVPPLITQQSDAGSATNVPQAFYPSALPGYMQPYLHFPVYSAPFTQPPFMPVTPHTIHAYCSALSGAKSHPLAAFPQATTHIPNDLPPSAFPRIQDWLTELDAGACGSNGQNFAQYTQVLQENGYMCIIQLADEGKVESGAKKLAICARIPVGIAKLLIKFAMADCAHVQRQ
jgi:hypothetical protein